MNVAVGWKRRGRRPVAAALLFEFTAIAPQNELPTRAANISGHGLDYNKVALWRRSQSSRPTSRHRAAATATAALLRRLVVKRRGAEPPP
jgi:hypothetical protein